MKLIFHPVSRSADQKPAPLTLNGSSFSIGRGSEQDITIADIRVPLQRARIVLRGDEPWIESVTPDPLWIDGHALLEAPLYAGRVIEIGRFAFEVAKLLPDGLELLATERYGAQDNLQQANHKYALGLRDLQLPVRALSWLLGLSVLMAGLAWPLWHVTGMGTGDSASPAGSRSDMAMTPAPATAPPQDRLADFLSSGGLSAAHRHFADRCEQCHVQPFRRVEDSACLRCHAAVDLHGNTGQMRVSSSVASACVDCHLEHQEDRRITLADARTCLACHQQAQGTQQGAVTHFRNAHPEFRVPEHRQGLAFPHDAHLAVDGIRGPNGDQVLECGSCHLPNATGGFQALEFEAHCEQCHSIDLLAESSADQTGPRTRVPHAALAEVRDFVRGHYSQLALRELPAETSVRKPPSSTSRQGRRQVSQSWAEAEAEREFADLVGRRSCVTCHEITQDAVKETPGGTPTWTMLEPAVPRDYLPRTDFDHRSHQSAACGDCHQAVESGTASDWLMPNKAQCLSCHGGDDQRDDGLANCQTCHSFHNTGLDWSLHPAVGAAHP